MNDIVIPMWIVTHLGMFCLGNVFMLGLILVAAHRSKKAEDGRS